jgi:hypothetical protein
MRGSLGEPPEYGEGEERNQAAEEFDDFRDL